MGQSNQSDIEMVDANCEYWLEVVRQLKVLKQVENDVHSQVKADLITRLQGASKKPLSFPAACSLIGVSSFIWGVVNLDTSGKHLKDYYNPEELRPLFKQQFFRSLAKHYSSGVSEGSKLAFIKAEVTQDSRFIKKMKLNWNSTLPAEILENAGVENITLCTKEFWDKKWSQKQDANVLRIVLKQLYHDNHDELENIERMNEANLRQFFKEHLSEDSSYLKKMNSWVDSVIQKKKTSSKPLPRPSLPITNTSDSPHRYEADRSKRRKLDEEDPESGESESNDDAESDEGDNAANSTQSTRESSIDPRTARKNWLDWYNKQEEDHNYTGNAAQEMLRTGFTHGLGHVIGKFRKTKTGNAWSVRFKFDNKHGLCARTAIGQMLKKALKEATSGSAKTNIQKNIDALDIIIDKVHVKRNTSKRPEVQSSLTVHTPPCVIDNSVGYITERTQTCFMPPLDVFREMTAEDVRKEIARVNEQNDEGSERVQAQLAAVNYKVKVQENAKSEVQWNKSKPAGTRNKLIEAWSDIENRPRFQSPLKTIIVGDEA